MYFINLKGKSSNSALQDESNSSFLSKEVNDPLQINFFLSSLLMDVSALERKLDACFLKDYSESQNSSIIKECTNKMRTVAAQMRQISQHPQAKSRENALLLHQLNSRMKTLVTNIQTLSTATSISSSPPKTSSVSYLGTSPSSLEQMNKVSLPERSNSLTTFALSFKKKEINRSFLKRSKDFESPPSNQQTTPKTEFSDKRTYVITELLETEKKYVSDLSYIITFYLNPLRAALIQPIPILPQDEVVSIFFNIEQIFK